VDVSRLTVYLINPQLSPVSQSNMTLKITRL
jgi:hypothetical protein